LGKDDKGIKKVQFYIPELLKHSDELLNLILY